MSDKPFHIAMYPWFAMGHLIPFLHISNKLAARGHKISFFLPHKTQAKLEPFNLHKDLISFIPITVPNVDGLPSGTETTADVPSTLYSLLVIAMDLTKPTIEASLCKLKPHFIFYDFTHWLPALARRLGIKPICHSVVSPTMGYFLSPERKKADFMVAPPSFPSSIIKLHAHESRQLTALSTMDFGQSISFRERIMTSIRESDAVSFRACREMEGAYCDYFEEQFRKLVILAGPIVPEPPTSALDERWVKWLDSFKAKSVIFCALGTEWMLEKDQFQELVLGFELTGIPFLVVLKPPMGVETIKSAMPEGFEERVMGRGVVHDGWVQQQLILRHPSMGCFVTHCGAGSLSEDLVSECQLVLLPHIGDHFINARVMAADLKVGVEIERGEEDGLFTRAGVLEAVKAVMDDDSNVGKEVKANHAKWREFLLREEIHNPYMDNFVQKLGSLLK